MGRMKVLHHSKIKRFENPPELGIEERINYFSLSPLLKEIDRFKTPTNKVSFILLSGYFQATKRFFNVSSFRKEDVDFVSNLLNIPIDCIKLNTYHKSTYKRHREMILEHFEIEAFNDDAHKKLFKKALQIVKEYFKPSTVFDQLIEYLTVERIEVPSYGIISEIIRKAFSVYEKKLFKKVDNALTKDQKELLDSLLTPIEERPSNQKVNKYIITQFKKSNQSTKTALIKENVVDFKQIKDIYERLIPAINQIQLSTEAVKYYATTVIKSKIFQVSRRKMERKYIHLLAFIIHQYYNFSDVLIEILIRSVQRLTNGATRKQKENYFEQRQEHLKAITQLRSLFKRDFDLVSEIESILIDETISDKEKLKQIKILLNKDKDRSDKFKKQMEKLTEETENAIKNEDYYDILLKSSRSQQLKLKDIVKNIEFNDDNSDPSLITAINYYRTKDKSMDNKAPIDFLDEKEQKIIFDKENKLKVSLYKVLLYIKIADAIKSGALNLVCSYKYKSVDEYLIPKSLWNKNREEYIKLARLEEFTEVDKLLYKLKQELHNQYKITNHNINKGSNPYISFDKNGDYKLKTPKVKKDNTASLLEYLPVNEYIPLIQILDTVNDYTNYLDAFEHEQIKYNKPKPTANIFQAGCICLGCNIGKEKMPKISKNISSYVLDHTINWYFSIDNINAATRKILETMNRMALPNAYKKNGNNHTSSDGQKYSIAVDSLNAGESFKYFGQGAGVSVNSFIDGRHFPFYSTVEKPTDREGIYIVDGLMENNDIIKSSMHSTDTHGYMETIFAITHLLGFNFAPRIKSFKDQQLYSFESIKKYEKAGYKILPDKYVNEHIIKDRWDDILRFIATIKLREAPASQLFKRLSSYAKQHPLYRAIKAFGQIIKSLFLLRFIDDVKLRQEITKQLNIAENSNKFSKAVFHGNNQDFIYALKEQQDIAEACKRLIKTCIICWNYLYLSQRYLETTNQGEKGRMLKALLNGSIEIWRHVNFQGIFDFKQKKSGYIFDLEKILRIEIQ